MLIILSGVETIHKKFIATNVVGRLNTFVVDGYNVNFINHVFKITDLRTNEVVFSAGEDTIGSWLVDNNEVVANVVALQQTIFLEGLRDNHFRNIFVDILADYGIAEPTFSNLGDEKLVQPHSYQDVIDNYNNRSYENFTITGSFSKVFVDRIRSELGAENVQVYNIVRHPSVSYLIQEKSPEYYQKYTGLLDAEMDHQKLMLSLVNCASLMRDPTIVTLRFEDMIRTGSFVINGKEVPVPEGYTIYNDWLTQWEFDNIVPLNLVNETAMTAFNQKMTSWGMETARTGEGSQLPSNIFELLGYTPMSHKQIISK
jgi:hypothetical protein